MALTPLISEEDCSHVYFVTSDFTIDSNFQNDKPFYLFQADAQSHASESCCNGVSSFLQAKVFKGSGMAVEQTHFALITSDFVV